VVDPYQDLERAATASKGTKHLTKSTWVNPMPQTEIASIDYVSAMTTAEPFLIAITAEP
jgi:hypothetical protein